VGAVGARC